MDRRAAAGFNSVITIIVGSSADTNQLCALEFCGLVAIRCAGSEGNGFPDVFEIVEIWRRASPIRVSSEKWVIYGFYEVDYPIWIVGDSAVIFDDDMDSGVLGVIK